MLRKRLVGTFVAQNQLAFCHIREQKATKGYWGTLNPLANKKRFLVR